MDKNPKTWQLLIALIPIFAALITWGFNMSTKQADFEARLRANEAAVVQLQSEYRADMKEIKSALQSILIRLGPEKYQIIKK